MKLALNKAALLAAVIGLFAAFGVFTTATADEPGGATAATFAWETQNMHFYDAARFTDDSVRKQLEDTIVAEFESRGLKFVDSAESADFLLSYVAVLENAASAAEVVAFWNANPDVAKDANRPDEIEEGMLYAKLIERGSRTKVWENTYRGLVVLDMAEETRAERLPKLVHEFLSNYQR
jgi:hypothetical protein